MQLHFRIKFQNGSISQEIHELEYFEQVEVDVADAVAQYKGALIITQLIRYLC